MIKFLEYVFVPIVIILGLLYFCIVTCIIFFSLGAGFFIIVFFFESDLNIVLKFLGIVLGLYVIGFAFCNSEKLIP